MDVKSLIKSILTGILVIYLGFVIVVDEIAISADAIAAIYGYGINLTSYESINIYTDYLKALRGIIFVYGSIGSFILDFLANHLSAALTADISHGSPTRFLIASLIPFVFAGIFIGLMADDKISYVLGSLISFILAPVLSYGISIYLGVSLPFDFLRNALTYAGFAFGVSLIPGIVFNILSNRAFEKEEEEEEEISVKEIDLDLEEEIEIGEEEIEDEEL